MSVSGGLGKRHSRRLRALRSIAMAAAVSVAMLGSIAVTATSASASEDKVWVCHATSSDTNPYRIINVSVSSTKNKGHLKHATNPNRTWNEAGVFIGVAHEADQSKPDIIGEPGAKFAPEKCGASANASLTLEKKVRNSGVSPSEWLLHATSEGTSFEGMTGTASATQAVANGTYALSETRGPTSGFTDTGWKCSNSKVDGRTVTIAADDTDVTCTITNKYQKSESDMATLTLVKELDGPEGPASAEDWTLSANGQTEFSGEGGASAAVAAGSYNLSEAYNQEDDGNANYTPSKWDCGDAEMNEAHTAVTVAENDVECTITNTYKPPPLPAHLTLVKSVVNDGGGTQSADVWTLWADGPTSISGRTGHATVTSAAVSPGAYVLRETGTQTNYAASAWKCGSATLTGGQLTLIADQDVTCTITNTYVPSPPLPAHLRLVKEVVNTYGDPADASAWTLYAKKGDTTTFSGAGGFSSTSVPAGSYELSESPSESPGPANYTPGDWSCTAGNLNQDGDILTLAAGQNATCTIKNTYTNTFEQPGGGGGGTPPAPTSSTDPARITLSATVENHFGGTARVSDFTLTATGIQRAPAAAAQNVFTSLAEVGTTAISFSGITGDAAITNAMVPAGTYTLSESALPQGYSKSAWVCAGGLQSGAEFTVRLGQSVSCNIIILDSAASVITTVVTPVVTPVVTTPSTVEPPVAAPVQVTELAFTGAEAVPLGLSGLLALLLGAGMILVSRRRATD